MTKDTLCPIVRSNPASNPAETATPENETYRDIDASANGWKVVWSVIRTFRRAPSQEGMDKTLIGNASDRDIRKVAEKMEQFRDAVTKLFSNVNLNSSVPTTVVVFKSDSSYQPFKPLYQGKPKNVAGYFLPGIDVNYITLTSELREMNPYGMIFHEYVIP